MGDDYEEIEMTEEETDSFDGMHVTVESESVLADRDEPPRDEPPDEPPRDEPPRDEHPRVYLPGDPLEPGEQLECDESAYEMLHTAQTGSPCLSFDVIRNPWHNQSANYPVAVHIAAGTQAPQTHANSIIIMQMSNLHKINEDEDSDEESSEEDEDEEVSNAPMFRCTLINHLGCVNRIRSAVCNNVVLAASWSELGRVNIWDISTPLREVGMRDSEKTVQGNSVNPMFSFPGHQNEGYGLDWSKTKKAVLASGDCKGAIHIWHPSEGAAWLVDQRPLVGHSASVEDLQWSPNESNVLASCSVDKSIRIWDVRAAPNKANKLTVENAHELDVNVINWNHNEPFIVSGGDDGKLHIWDLRQLKSGRPVASFKHHTQPVTTVEWHPEDSTVFASGGADHQIALWDISVERDTENLEDDIERVPAQLLFIHQGQTDIKELHWHPQFSGAIISTAQSGFNIFKTISV